jgi:hypothetical protein
MMHMRFLLKHVSVHIEMREELTPELIEDAAFNKRTWSDSTAESGRTLCTRTLFKIC